MRILKLLGSEEITDTEKLEGLKAFTTIVREKYGNTDIDIDEIKVNTADGHVPLSLLTDAEKVAVATQRVKTAVATATIACENTQGAKFDRVLEGMISIDPILCNLDSTSDSEY